MNKKRAASPAVNHHCEYSSKAFSILCYCVRLTLMYLRHLLHLTTTLVLPSRLATFSNFCPQKGHSTKFLISPLPLTSTDLTTISRNYSAQKYIFFNKWKQKFLKKNHIFAKIHNTTYSAVFKRHTRFILRGCSTT